MELVSDTESTGDDEVIHKSSGTGGSSSKANEGSSSRPMATSGRPARAATKNVRYEDPTTDEDESHDEEAPRRPAATCSYADRRQKGKGKGKGRGAR